MNIGGPYLGQLDASFSARRDHLGATPEKSATDAAQAVHRSPASAAIRSVRGMASGWAHHTDLGILRMRGQGLPLACQSEAAALVQAPSWIVGFGHP
jgi:hypothetical protein